eukprot:TRINITY_DN6332_c0_g1_i2.p2 TRINITY_DN6332_c0_g1~~TRINITY_DN6332_c0_g1_i2.p2  ORF type:complete len:160 (+),score=34.47 TRINITY_DN6332_c0_g1_i2:17-496(+)
MYTSVSGGQYGVWVAGGILFFFFSSRRRHTRCREVSWARRCVQETGYQRRVHGHREPGQYCYKKYFQNKPSIDIGQIEHSPKQIKTDNIEYHRAHNTKTEYARRMMHFSVQIEILNDKKGRINNYCQISEALIKQCQSANNYHTSLVNTLGEPAEYCTN